ncbi:exonuclease SbcC, partial [Escherichia coli EC1846]
MVWEK